MNGQGPLTLSALTYFPLCVFKCLAIPAPGVKEDAEDSPLSQALYHCFQRLDKDRSRGNITAEEWLRLREKAQELYHTAVQQKPGTETEPSVPMPGFILKYCGSWITLSTLKPTEMLYQSTSMTDEWNTWGSWVNSTPPSYFSAIISMLRRPRPLWLGLLETYRPSTFLISS